MHGQQELWAAEELVPIRDKVYQYLKQQILNGVYKAGDRLVERELAGQLGISRTPIREALFRLESAGLVVTVPRRGVVVTQISREEIEEIFTILSSLEALAVRLAAQKIDDQTAVEFGRMIRQIDLYLNGDSKQEIGQLHIEINEQIYKAAKSPRLYEMLSGLLDYIRAFAHLGHEMPGRMEQAMREHRDILEAVRNKEVELAENLTKIHIENSRKAYLRATQGKEV
ncbi:GntR family transcriptional regulator [Effusibacillus pohliae]|uniref:GntR family transcriptional regulator n=1 Tax=Effusibacillus pohliae TaxID=232270 RepID=UPI00036B2144|nr:GntR family transcriptional regulator [Effusibacillus pohliae]